MIKPQPSRGGTAEEHSRAANAEDLNAFVRESLRGDPFALRKLLQTIAPQVRSVCRGVLGRDSQDLEDTIQDCLIDVVRALPQFRYEADFTHYVTKITIRRAIANRQRLRARAKPLVAVPFDSLPDAKVDDAVESRADLVRKLLDDLNESQSTVLRLRLMLGHSMDEIASMTGVSVNTVKTRLRLGKNQLRRWLTQKGEGPSARR
jgi:RNA polymerase sigma factor (sigma-70 family)